MWSTVIQFKGQAILLDIEGTTSSISYVYEVMFPYVREHLAGFLADQWNEPDLNQAVEQLAADQGTELADWLGTLDDEQSQRAVESKAIELMDSDSKTTGLKNLQGQIWKSGFETGKLVGHLFDDVAPAIKLWKASGKRVYIYSSGSIAAQKLYFGNCDAGNLLPLIDGHFDTTIGNKREVESYRTIASEIKIASDRTLFVSDVVAELDAAKTCGMNTTLSIRPGNPPLENPNSHIAITSFAEIEIDH